LIDEINAPKRRVLQQIKQFDKGLKTSVDFVLPTKEELALAAATGGAGYVIYRAGKAYRVYKDGKVARAKEVDPGNGSFNAEGDFGSLNQPKKSLSSRLSNRTVEESLERVSEIRSRLGVGKKRNIAFAEFEIDGKVGELVGVSGRASRPGTVGIPENPRFEKIATGNNPRTLDSEAKILEDLASKLPPNARGTVNLFSELPLCVSCSNVVPQFQRAFPNIILNVSNGPAR